MALPITSMMVLPQDDSAKSWMIVLEDAVSRHPKDTAYLDAQLAELEGFYGDMSYWPFALTATSAVGNVSREWRSPRGGPARARNSFVYASNHVRCEFNVSSPNQSES